MESASRAAVTQCLDSTVTDWAESVEKDQYDRLMKLKGTGKATKWKGWSVTVEDGAINPKRKSEAGWLIPEQYIVKFKRA